MLEALLRSCLSLLLLSLMTGCQQSDLPPLPDDELQPIARLIYRNECASRPLLLTSWNQGEGFASLGIGHFIWYPQGTAADRRPFHESFPELLAFLQHQGVSVPDWLKDDAGAPWPDRAHFLAAIDSERMRSLRALLQSTIPLQAHFMQQRMLRSLPLMQAGLPGERQHQLRKQFMRLAASPMGYYALIDYVNFKGEGVSVSERYQGKGWGLRQVLLGMQGEKPGLVAIQEFVATAGDLLKQRVSLAPPVRREQRWLPGWLKRLDSYLLEAKRLNSVRLSGIRS